MSQDAEGNWRSRKGHVGGTRFATHDGIVPFTTEMLKTRLEARLKSFDNDTAHARIMQMHETDVRILALTMIGEGASESLDGRVAIGWTVKNRSFTKGRTIADRALQRAQYSCWWPFGGAANYERLIAFADKVTTGADISHDPLFPVYMENLVLAGGVIDGRLRDRTKGSTHYLTLALLRSNPPTWVDRPPTTVIGSHAFFAGIPWS